MKPKPAIQAFDIHSSRVVIGAAHVGWINDLRADDPITRDGQLIVPVLPESEYYRALDDETTAEATMLPADQVWVETEAANPAKKVGPVLSLLDNLVDPDVPQTRSPMPASEAPGLTGRRVWYWDNVKFRADYRCVSEPFETGPGDIGVRIVQEAEWYRWHRTGVLPQSMDALLHFLWVQ